MKDSIQQLRDVTVIQKSDGNWNHDPYMHGMANGLELALAIMEGREPEYLDAPDQWLADKPASPTANPSRPSPKCETHTYGGKENGYRCVNCGVIRPDRYDAPHRQR